MGHKGTSDVSVDSAEASLVDRLLTLQTAEAPSVSAGEKQQWYADAYAFLRAHGGEHWWCRHSDVTAGEAAVAFPSPVEHLLALRTSQRGQGRRPLRWQAFAVLHSPRFLLTQANHALQG